MGGYDDIVAVSPSTTYRVLKAAGRLDRKNVAPSKKGTGFVQPEKAHKHWHVDVSYLNLGGTFYIAKDFKTFVRLAGLTHVRTSPYYPQSNGKLERFHGILKDECIRRTCPASKEEAEKRVQLFVQHYNHVRLHSAIGYVCPADKLAGLEKEIGSERDRKLEEARHRRELARKAKRQVA